MSDVNWPAGFEPGRASLHVVNTTQAVVGPERLWPWLAFPARWPEYYVNAQRVRHLDGPWPEVAVGSRFRWCTFGMRITSVVTECEPDERLAWTWTGLGARGHHSFILAAAGWGTTVSTEETVLGAPARIARPLLRPVMLYFHQRWIEGLAQRGLASAGTP